MAGKASLSSSPAHNTMHVSIQLLKLLMIDSIFLGIRTKLGSPHRWNHTLLCIQFMQWLSETEIDICLFWLDFVSEWILVVTTHLYLVYWVYVKYEESVGRLLHLSKLVCTPVLTMVLHVAFQSQ